MTGWSDTTNMVNFDADLTDPPAVSSNDPSGTVMSWVGYVLIAGLAFVALGVASNVIAPAVGNLLSTVGVESGEGGVTVSTSGGGL